MGKDRFKQKEGRGGLKWSAESVAGQVANLLAGKEWRVNELNERKKGEDGSRRMEGEGWP